VLKKFKYLRFCLLKINYFKLKKKLTLLEHLTKPAKFRFKSTKRIIIFVSYTVEIINAKYVMEEVDPVEQVFVTE